VAVVEGTGVKLTPMLAQYLRFERAAPRRGLDVPARDFYEMFFEDAQRASAILDITLTARNKSDPNPIPLCGVPFHAVDGYIQKLLAAGLKVAICEQVEDPKGAKGLVDRDVVRVITPGTVLEEENLDPRSASFLAVVARSTDGFGLAACDLSTGEVRVMEFSAAAGRESGATTDAPTRLADDETLDAVAEELARLGAKELVVAPELQPVLPRLTAQATDIFQSLAPPEWFDGEEAAAWLATGGETAAPVGTGGRAALGGLRAYLRATYRGRLDHLRLPELVRPHDTLVLDQTTRSNLNLVDGGWWRAARLVAARARPHRHADGKPDAAALDAGAAHEPRGDRRRLDASSASSRTSTYAADVRSALTGLWATSSASSDASAPVARRRATCCGSRPRSAVRGAARPAGRR
jgi:DNA mismatch repair protein MutS